jgi:hypothetical protein
MELEFITCGDCKHAGDKEYHDCHDATFRCTNPDGEHYKKQVHETGWNITSFICKHFEQRTDRPVDQSTVRAMKAYAAIIDDLIARNKIATP